MDVKVLGLDETSSVAYNSDETQTSNYFVLLFGRDRLANFSQA